MPSILYGAGDLARRAGRRFCETYVPVRGMRAGFAELTLGPAGEPIVGRKNVGNLTYFCAVRSFGDVCSNSAVSSAADGGAGTLPAKICSPETFFP